MGTRQLPWLAWYESATTDASLGWCWSLVGGLVALRFSVHSPAFPTQPVPNRLVLVGVVNRTSTYLGT